MLVLSIQTCCFIIAEQHCCNNVSNNLLASSLLNNIVATMFPTTFLLHHCWTIMLQQCWTILLIQQCCSRIVQATTEQCLYWQIVCMRHQIPHHAIIKTATRTTSYWIWKLRAVVKNNDITQQTCNCITITEDYNDTQLIVWLNWKHWHCVTVLKIAPQLL